MSLFYHCLDNTCKFYLRPIYAQRGAIHSHYAKKEINILVLTAYNNGITADPFESHSKLIWKIIEKSKVPGGLK